MSSSSSLPSNLLIRAAFLVFVWLGLGWVQGASAGPNGPGDFTAPIVIGADGLPDFDAMPLHFDRPVHELIGRELGGVPGPEGIWNGSNVSNNQHDHVVALAMSHQTYGTSVFCSGSLIAHRWVLTAAHCLTDLPGLTAQGFSLYVLFGNDLYVQIDDAVEFVDYYPHAQYNDENLSNDVAVLHLEWEKYGVDFAVLNDEAVHSGWLGETMTLLGFGITSDGGQDSGVKRITQAPVDEFDGMFLVTYNPNSNLCQGDSGGPTFRQTSQGPHQVGINTFVTPGCVGGAGGLTRVDVFIPWIRGFVPGVLTEGSGAGSGGTDPGNGGGNEPNLPDPDEVDDFDVPMDDPTRPTGNSYPNGLRCDALGSTPWIGGAWLAGLLLLSRRRR